ncbi:thialysine N-epsilon-acetyltransferase-like [Babylonia areolata]|uniref:thialysine N-epsilon-acetyltransferase-like n=1 Tax=Babylonia areolata TaxID=304850 RepID=UPI003FD4B94E
MTTFNIREAREDDCEEIMRMITELAVYEKMADQVEITAKDLKRDAFGEKPFFHALVAELVPEGSKEEGRRPLIGYVMYYYTYSPWYGRTCTMEDLYVAQEHRGKGIGCAMWAKVAELSLAQNCSYMSWVVVDWNKSSIDLYKRRGCMDMTEKEGWLLYRMEKDAMEKLIAETSPGNVTVE